MKRMLTQRNNNLLADLKKINFCIKRFFLFLVLLCANCVLCGAFAMPCLYTIKGNPNEVVKVVDSKCNVKEYFYNEKGELAKKALNGTVVYAMKHLPNGKTEFFEKQKNGNNWTIVAEDEQIEINEHGNSVSYRLLDKDNNLVFAICKKRDGENYRSDMFSGKTDMFDEFRGISLQMQPLKKDKFAIEIKLINKSKKKFLKFNQTSLCCDFMTNVCVMANGQYYYGGSAFSVCDRPDRERVYKDGDILEVSDYLSKSLFSHVVLVMKQNNLDWPQVKSVEFSVRFLNIFNRQGALVSYEISTKPREVDLDVLKTIISANSEKLYKVQMPAGSHTAK